VQLLSFTIFLAFAMNISVVRVR